MVEEWRVEEAKMYLRLVRFLLVDADKRGMTHGEKHHYLFVAISLIGCAQSELNDSNHSVLTHNDYQELKADQIPF